MSKTIFVLDTSPDFINPGNNPFKKVAVVLLSYNCKHLLEKFLPKTLETDYDDFEVVLVDNASTDGTFEYIREQYPQMKLIRIKVNKGFTNGYAESLPFVRSEYYVLLSADVEVTPDWINPVIELMDGDPQIAACGPKIKSYHKKTHFEYAGAAGGYIDKYGYPFCRGRIIFEVEEDKGQYDEITEVFWASGAAYFIRAKLYHGIGGFDNDYYAHMEEIDLSWRLKNAGYKVMICPKAEVFHVGGSVISYGSPAKLYRNYRNSLIMLVKNLPSDRLIPVLATRVALDYAAVLKLLLSFNFKEIGAIFKAHSNFFSGMGKWLEKRKMAKKMVTNPNLNGIYPKSIIFQFFLFGKKKFSDLNYNVNTP